MHRSADCTHKRELLLNSRKKYGLVWKEKEKAVEELLREQLPVLTEVVEKRIVAPVPSRASGTGTNSHPEVLEGCIAPDHILIEGDNLHALTALQYTHAESFDAIYIDPPYNTGNKSWKAVLPRAKRKMLEEMEKEGVDENG